MSDRDIIEALNDIAQCEKGKPIYIEDSARDQPGWITGLRIEEDEIVLEVEFP